MHLSYVSVFTLLTVGPALVTAASQATGSAHQTTSKTGTASLPKLTEPCAIISHGLSSWSAAHPSATGNPPVGAQVAYECALSAPIVVDDAVKLLDGLIAYFQFQSDLAYLKDPPSGYLLAGVDLLGSLAELQKIVQNGDFKSEILFEEELAKILGQTHDGHLQFTTDGMGVFDYVRHPLIGSLVSVSVDGEQLPQVYTLGDITAGTHGNTSYNPSPVSLINSVQATEWLTAAALNTTIRFQDPDALWNSLFWTVSAADGDDGTQGYFTSPFPNYYIGPSTNVTFANGSFLAYGNQAYTSLDFTGVNDGKSFYHKFCDAQYKKAHGQGGSKVKRSRTRRDLSAISGATQKQIDNPRGAYPPAVIESADGAFAGYFLNATGFENVAVLSILSDTEDAVLSAQQTMKKFIKLCQENGKDHLIIDQTSNPGGLILLGYEVFKQLFPNIAPFAGSNLRATPEYNILGTAGTQFADQGLAKHNETLYIQNGAYQIYDGDSFLNQFGVPFKNWEEYFGPEERYNDEFTRLIRWNISNPGFQQVWGKEGMVLSHTDNIGEPPFLPENMIMINNGECSSTCTTTSHMLKWQGKVKSIAFGGRPQPGPMQAVGGVKGKNVYPFSGLAEAVIEIYGLAPESLLKEANKTHLKTMLDTAEYLALRTSDPQDTSGIASLNIQNLIAQYDASFTPQQFVYEAADCRLWYTPQMVLSADYQWQVAAEQAWGLNGQTVFGKCVPGSVGDPSSLTGNPVLFAGGVPANVTVYAEEPGVVVPSGISVLGAGPTSSSVSVVQSTSSSTGVAAAAAATTAAAAPAPAGAPQFGPGSGPPKVRRWEA